MKNRPAEGGASARLWPLSPDTPLERPGHPPARTGSIPPHASYHELLAKALARPLPATFSA